MESGSGETSEAFEERLIIMWSNGYRKQVLGRFVTHAILAATSIDPTRDEHLGSFWETVTPPESTRRLGDQSGGTTTIRNVMAL